MANRQPLNDQVEDEFLSTVEGYDPTDEGDNDVGQQDDVIDNNVPDDAGGGDDSAGIDPRQQQQLKPEQKPQEGTRYDQYGNVIDSRGNVVAPNGRYRRLDEQNKRYKSILENTQQQLVKARQDLAAANFLNGAPSKLGLSHDETAAALDMMHLFKTNPAQLIQVVLAESAARGVDLNKVLGQNISAVQTDAIKRMLDERLAPIDRAAKAQEETRRVEAATNERYNNFLGRYPDAAPHQDAIAELMRSQGLNETEAYFRVREFALRNQFDFEQPLGPQVRARVMQRQQQGGARQPQQRNERRPMINGRAPQQRMVERKVNVASPDRSYASIVDEALAEAGFN